MTYYISGPMTGIENHNRPAFEAAETRLIALGHFVLSPIRNIGKRYSDALTDDLERLCKSAHALYMLNGWEHSPGARAEHAVAVALDLHIAYEGEA